MKKYSMETYSLFIPLIYLDLTYYIYIMMVLNNGHNVICSVGMMLVIGLPRDMKCVKEAKEHLTLSREALYSIDTKNKYMHFVT